MENLRKLIKLESEYPVSDRIIDIFLSQADIIPFKRNEKIFAENEISANIWIVKEGIVRLCGIDQGKDKTYAFGLPGTICMSKHSMVKNQPSTLRMEACCPTVMMKVPKESVVKLMEEEPEFAIWLVYLAWEELYYQEKKNVTVSNGSAIDRLRTLYVERPELIRSVNQKHIASYLDITCEYYTRIKKKLLKQ